MISENTSYFKISLCRYSWSNKPLKRENWRSLLIDFCQVPPGMRAALELLCVHTMDGLQDGLYIQCDTKYYHHYNYSYGFRTIGDMYERSSSKMAKAWWLNSVSWHIIPAKVVVRPSCEVLERWVSPLLSRLCCQSAKLLGYPRIKSNVLVEHASWKCDTYTRCHI